MSKTDELFKRLNVKRLKDLFALLRPFISSLYLKKVVAVIVAVCFITNILGPAAFASNQGLPGEKEKKEAERIEYVLSNPNIPFTPSAIAQLKVKVEPNGVISVLENNKKTWRPLGYWNGQDAFTPKADGKFSKEGNDGLRQACEQYFKNNNVPVDVTVVKKMPKTAEQIAQEKLQKELVSATMPAPPENILKGEEDSQSFTQRFSNIQTVSQLLKVLGILTNSASSLTSGLKESILNNLAKKLGIALNISLDQLKTIYAFLVQFFANGGSVINCAVDSLSSLLGITDTVQKTSIGISLLLTDILSGNFNLQRAPLKTRYSRPWLQFKKWPLQKASP